MTALGPSRRLARCKRFPQLNLSRSVRCRVRNKSRFGRAAEFGAWAHHEFATLNLLHTAGADVPCPVKAASNAILIEFVGQGGHPAPQLRDVRLSPAEAERLLEQALRNIEIMLSCSVVHGDLSAYNMLCLGGHLRVIDLPQAVDARTNRHAKSLLVRDVANVCGYFAAHAPTPSLAHSLKNYGTSISG